MLSIQPKNHPWAFAPIQFKYSINWTEVSAVTSPSGKFTAYHLRSNDDGVGEAPYGDHIALSSSFWPTARYSHVVFADYCGPLKYQWMDEQRLKIECATDRTEGQAKRLKSFNGITIEYVISTPVPHNHSLDRPAAR